MSRYFQTPHRQLLHPRHPLLPPTLPLWAQPHQILPIHRAQHHIEDILETLYHGPDRIRKISPAMAAESPRAFFGTAVPTYGAALDGLGRVDFEDGEGGVPVFFVLIVIITLLAPARIV